MKNEILHTKISLLGVAEMVAVNDRSTSLHIKRYNFAFYGHGSPYLVSHAALLPLVRGVYEPGFSLVPRPCRSEGLNFLQRKRGGRELGTVKVVFGTW